MRTGVAMPPVIPAVVETGPKPPVVLTNVSTTADTSTLKVGSFEVN